MFNFDAMGQEKKLVIDVGNTRSKIAFFIGDDIAEISAVKGNFSGTVSKMISVHGEPQKCIVSRVNMEEGEILTALPFNPSRVIFLRSGLLLPVKVLYKTPETLGNDRLANVCGAWALNPNRNSLVIDMGTCIKYDFISGQGNYTGGSISPGLIMRYKALSRFTSQLPYFKPADSFPPLTGSSTEGSIRSGVENGILAEINGIIDRYQELFDQTHIIVTGGDHPKFADKLKSPIFVAPNLTLSGLKIILDYNDQ